MEGKDQNRQMEKQELRGYRPRETSKKKKKLITFPKEMRVSCSHETKTEGLLNKEISKLQKKKK